MKKIFLIILAGLYLQGCTHLASVSTSSIPKVSKRNKPVTTQVKRMIFLGLNFDNNYVNDITFNLASQCKNGKVQGVVTKHERVLYLPPFVFEERITASGYCVRG